jgi:hypothetical protein
MHRLPFRPKAFDVALASFAFNSTDPVLSMREAWRILVPGGRLIMQEWEETDSLSELFADTIADYAVENPSPELAAMRTEKEAAHPWDDVIDVADIVEELEQAEFTRIEGDVVTVPVRFANASTFIRYKLAWPGSKTEVDAMPGEMRRLCLSELREKLAVHAGADGGLIWQPRVVRIRAYKPLS